MIVNDDVIEEGCKLPQSDWKSRIKRGVTNELDWLIVFCSRKDEFLESDHEKGINRESECSCDSETWQLK